MRLGPRDTINVSRNRLVRSLQNLLTNPKTLYDGREGRFLVLRTETHQNTQIQISNINLHSSLIFVQIRLLTIENLVGSGVSLSFLLAEDYSLVRSFQNRSLVFHRLGPSNIPGGTLVR